MGRFVKVLAMLVALCAALVAAPSVGSAQPTVASEFTRIISASASATGKCLGISNQGTGNEVQMVPCNKDRPNGKAWEYWYIDTLPSGDVRLRSASVQAWKKCIDASRGKGKQLIMVSCDGSANQAFRKSGRTTYTLESVRYRGQCADIRDWAKSNVVQLWDCHGLHNQYWWSIGGA